MDFKQIQELIRFVSKSGVNEVSIEQGDFKITIKTQEEKAHFPGQMPMDYHFHAPQSQMQHIQPQAPMMASAMPAMEAPKPAVAPIAEPVANTVMIKSPMIGTLYRKPSPDKEVFVKVGDKVSKGQVVCIIEAMKLFNEIESEVSGTIVKILSDDNAPVEFDQPLFLVEQD